MNKTNPDEPDQPVSAVQPVSLGYPVGVFSCANITLPHSGEVSSGTDLPQVVVLDRRGKSGAHHRATTVKKPFYLSLGLWIAFSRWTPPVGTFQNLARLPVFDPDNERVRVGRRS
jgi:hypothetical protein